MRRRISFMLMWGACGAGNRSRCAALSLTCNFVAFKCQMNETGVKSVLAAQNWRRVFVLHSDVRCFPNF